jgi:hypothetical protein
LSIIGILCKPTSHGKDKGKEECDQANKFAESICVVCCFPEFDNSKRQYDEIGPLSGDRISAQAMRYAGFPLSCADTTRRLAGRRNGWFDWMTS